MTIVRAAGGVVYRGGEDGGHEILLVHRPAYDDWTFPKGKLKPSERDEEAALREVEEETGLRCRLERELAGVSYRDRRGRPKIVKYWVMRPLGGRFQPSDEVDRVVWLRLEDAIDALSYEHDRLLLRMIEANGTGGRPLTVTSQSSRTVSLYLIRHAKAGSRQDWSEPDHLRPLDEEGFLQADRLVDLLKGLPVARILSSPYVRCRQTVELLARERGLPIELDDRLAEGAEPETVEALLSEVATRPTVLCTHGDGVEHVLTHLVREGVLQGGDLKLKKGSIWVLESARRRIVRARYVPPPG